MLKNNKEREAYFSNRDKKSGGNTWKNIIMFYL